MDNYKILAVEWRSAKHTVGFVAYDTQNPASPGEWNSVVGFSPYSEIFKPQLEQEDTQYIAANGAKLEWQLAEILFPNLDIKLHKYYGGKE